MRHARSLFSARGGGFTLIELLVVVAIIALLISILLPSMNRARDVARRVACGSNQRQIGVAFQMYANDFSQKIPFGYWYNNSGSPRNWDWSWDDMLFAYVGVKLDQNVLDSGGAYGHTDTRLFLCPSDEVSRERTYTMPRTFGKGVGRSVWQSGTAPAQLSVLDVRLAASTILLAERPASHNILGSLSCSVTDTPDLQLQPDMGGIWLHPPEYSYLMVDGHVEALLRENTVGNGTLLDPEGMWTRSPDD